MTSLPTRHGHQAQERESERARTSVSQTTDYLARCAGRHTHTLCWREWTSCESWCTRSRNTSSTTANAPNCDQRERASTRSSSAGIHIPFVGENEQAANHGALVHATQAAPPPTLLTAIRERASTRSSSDTQRGRATATTPTRSGERVEISWRRGNERSWPPLIGPFVLFYLAGYRYTQNTNTKTICNGTLTQTLPSLLMARSLSLSILLDWHKVSCERCLFLGTQGAIGSHARHEGLLWRWRDTRAGSGRLWRLRCSNV